LPNAEFAKQPKVFLNKSSMFEKSSLLQSVALLKRYTSPFSTEATKKRKEKKRLRW
jgi:hypothetical protein